MSQALPFLVSILTVACGTALLAAPNRGDVFATQPWEKAAAAGRTSSDQKPRFAAAREGFHVNALVDGQPVLFLLDTGASITVLGAADAHRLGVASKRAHLISGISGNVRAKIASVDLEIAGRRMDDVDVAVVAEMDRSLLGMDVLHKLGKPELVIK